MYSLPINIHAKTVNKKPQLHNSCGFCHGHHYLCQRSAYSEQPKPAPHWNHHGHCLRTNKKLLRFSPKSSSAVRRGFYPNPQNAPCIKWLHALPKVEGYTLVTRFYTSKSVFLNALSMNLYTANVTSPFGTCKLYRLNRYTLYSSCSQRVRRLLKISPL